MEQSEVDNISSIEPTDLDKELENILDQDHNNTNTAYTDGDDRLESPHLGEGEPDLFSSMLNETSETSIDEKKVYTFDILNSKLHEFTSHRDEVAIQRHSNYLATLQVQLHILLHAHFNTRYRHMHTYIYSFIHTYKFSLYTLLHTKIHYTYIVIQKYEQKMFKS